MDQGKTDWRGRHWLLIGPLLLAFALGGTIAWPFSNHDATIARPYELALTGRVTDAAHILTDEQIGRLDQYLANFEACTRHQMVVVTVDTLNGRDIAEYTLELANRWGVGRKGVNDGVVVLVAPNERKVRIEVGYGLEKVLTDRYCKHVIDSVMIPQFKARGYYDGLMLGVTGLARVARRV